MLTLLLVCSFSPRKYKSILRGFYNKDSLPGDASYASLLTNRLSQATVGCLMFAYSFSPRVQSIPRGPRFPLAMTECVARNGKNIPYKTARIASHNFTFEITLSQAITLTLLLVCAFSPRVHSIPRGPLPIKSQNFDEIVFFSAGSEKSSVLGVHDFSGSAEKAEYRKTMTF